MKFLIDKSAADVRDKMTSGLVGGQLLTPLTRYGHWGGSFAIDNGAYTRFNRKGFRNLLERNSDQRQRCLFVCCPDIVGNARRTMELFQHRHDLIPGGWPIALVAQDGLEELDIPWAQLSALFIGGSTEWKDSRAVEPLIKAAQILGKHTHVGRVNTYARYRRFAVLGVDTCDGSGVSQYDHMMEAIVRGMKAENCKHPLFQGTDDHGQDA